MSPAPKPFFVALLFLLSWPVVASADLKPIGSETPFAKAPLLSTKPVEGADGHKYYLGSDRAVYKAISDGADGEARLLQKVQDEHGLRIVLAVVVGKRISYVTPTDQGWKHVSLGPAGASNMDSDASTNTTHGVRRTGDSNSSSENREQTRKKRASNIQNR